MCGPARADRVDRMTARRAPKPPVRAARPAGAVTVGLLLAVLAGVGWLAGMIWTIAGWSG
jgi:hypothetical protein